jgi:uncharacterized protein YqgV (UPF0045/DUF77 family)
VIVEIEVLPQPMGTPDDPYRHVEAAIAEIEGAGVTFEVGALGTTYEASPDVAWTLARQVHDACLAAGARSVLTVVKLAQAVAGEEPTIAALTQKYRA